MWRTPCGEALLEVLSLHFDLNPQMHAKNLWPTLLKLKFAPGCQTKGISGQLRIIDILCWWHDQASLVSQPYRTPYVELWHKDEQLQGQDGIDQCWLHMWLPAHYDM